MQESVNKSSQNTLSKSFERQAVKLVKDRDYSVSDFDNAEFFGVPHQESVDRLNNTMKRLRDGNAQIFYTMLYKDIERPKLLIKFWNTIVVSEEFKRLPKELQELELEQIKHVGPMSRFSEEKLWEDFVGHIDSQAKQKNTRYSEYEEAADAVLEYWTILGKEALMEDPSLKRYIDIDLINERLPKAMPNDKSGGYRYFSNVDVEIGGVIANDLYYKDYLEWKKQQWRQMLFEEFCRVQAKGNKLFDSVDLSSQTTVKEQDYSSNSEDDSNSDIWEEEKNRCVQGDSRSMQFPYKPMSDVLTKVVKDKDVNLLGWRDFETRNVLMHNMFKEFYGKYDFDSFDAKGYDWSTDPRNQILENTVIIQLSRNLGMNTDYFISERAALNHYSYDPTITTRGIFKRAGSTPSGANLTGPGGTVGNYIRCWLQTADLFGISPRDLLPIMLDYNKRGIPLWSCVGDDAWQLREKGITAEQIAEINQLCGFRNHADKVVLSDKYIHFLQLGYYYDGKEEYLSYGSVSRALEKLLFQETANEHENSLAMTGSAMQQLTNSRFNPLQPYLVDFAMEGDPKWRLGAKDPAGFLKAASNGKTPAEFFDRMWDPNYTDTTWENFAEANRTTFENIARAAEKFAPATGVL